MSKFSGVLKAARERDQEKPAASKKGSNKPTPSSSLEKRGRGRPAGKRSNPDYEQVTAYIRKDTYSNVKIELIKEGQKREFSELAEELLAKWLKSRG